MTAMVTKIVRDIMSTDLITIDRYDTFSELRKKILSYDIHHLPVTENNKLIGIISTADILKHSFGTASVGQDTDIDEYLDRVISVNAIMKTQPVTVTADMAVPKAAEILFDSPFNALPVIDAENNLIGMVTTKDLIGYLINDK